MDIQVITKSTVFIEYSEGVLKLTNQVVSTYPSGPEGSTIREYEYVCECALDYAQAINHLIENKMKKDRVFKITVEYGKK